MATQSTFLAYVVLGGVDLAVIWSYKSHLLLPKTIDEAIAVVWQLRS